MNTVIAIAAIAFLVTTFSWLPRHRKFKPGTLKQIDTENDITVIISACSPEQCELSARRALEQVGVAQVLLVIDTNFQKIEDPRLRVIHATEAPPGWCQKRWGQQQALAQVATQLVLLLDGDVELIPFTASSLRATLLDKSLNYVSLTPAPRLVTRLERTLLPLLMYLDRLRYPWLMPARSGLFARATTKCLLIQLCALEQIDGLGRISNTADDGAWGKVLNAGKFNGRHLFSHAARHHSPVIQQGDIQHYDAHKRSGTLLALLIVFVSPLIALFFTEPPYFLVIFGLWLGILGSYLPTLRYYNLHPVKLLLFPGAILLLVWVLLRLRWSHNGGEQREWHSELIETGVET